MLEKLESKLDELKQEEKKLMDELTKDFRKGTIYLGCGLGESVEELITVKAKIELLEELIEEGQ